MAGNTNLNLMENLNQPAVQQHLELNLRMQNLTELDLSKSQYLRVIDIRNN